MLDIYSMGQLQGNYMRIFTNKYIYVRCSCFQLYYAYFFYNDFDPFWKILHG